MICRDLEDQCGSLGQPIPLSLFFRSLTRPAKVQTSANDRVFREQPHPHR